MARYLEVFDKNMVRTGFLVDADEITRKRRINSDYELSFMVPMNSEDYTDKIRMKGHVRDERGQFYVINSRSRDRSGKKRMAKIECMHVMFKLADFKMPYDLYVEEAYGININYLTDRIVTATNGKFTFSIEDTFELKDVKDWGRGNCLEALNEIIKLFECEIEPDNFTIRIKKKIGSNKGLQYRIKKNIISASFQDDVRALVTRMFSQMKDGLTFIGLDASHLTQEERDLLSAIPGAIVNGKLAVNYLISPYAASWANNTNTFYDGEVIFQDIEDQLELLEATRKALREHEVPAIEIRVTAADLFKIDQAEPKPFLGDEVICIDPDMEMNHIPARIVELTEYPYTKEKHASVTLANFMKRDFEDIIADLDRSKRIVDDLLSGGRIRASAFEEFAKQAVIDINNSKTEVKYDQRGIVLESKLNPAHQVIHSSVGTILTTDGGQTARVAITAEGIAAPYIVGVLGEFAQVKTDNLIAGNAKISHALIESIRANQIDVSGGKIIADQIDIRGITVSNGSQTTFAVSSSGAVTIAGNITMLGGSINWTNVNTDPATINAQNTANSAIAISNAIANGTYSGGTFIDGKLIYAPSIYGGTIVGGQIISNSTIDVTTDIRLGNNIYLTGSYGSSQSITFPGSGNITFNNDWITIASFDGIGLSSYYIELYGAVVTINNRNILAELDEIWNIIS